MTAARGSTKQPCGLKVGQRADALKERVLLGACGLQLGSNICRMATGNPKIPQVQPRGRRVKLPHERETGASAGHAGRTAEHCQAADGVKSPTPSTDRIAASGSASVAAGRACAGVCESFGAGTCGDGELKRLTGLLQLDEN